MRKQRLVSYLDQYIDINCIRDSSLNGLQVDGASEVKRVAVGVDTRTWRETFASKPLSKAKKCWPDSTVPAVT